jgi:hypothetical protein
VDLFRRVLQVGVEGDDDVAAGLFEAGQDRHVLAVVAVEEHHAGHVRTLAVLLGQDRHRVVAAAVVDEDDFVGQAQLVHRGIQAREQVGQAGFLVIDRDDDRQLRLHAAHGAAHRVTDCFVQAHFAGTAESRTAFTAATARSTSTLVMA